MNTITEGVNNVDTNSEAMDASYMSVGTIFESVDLMDNLTWLVDAIIGAMDAS